MAPDPTAPLPVSLAPGYLPPYGSALTAASFAWQGEAWVADGMDASGESARYELAPVGDGTARCRVNGQPVRYQHPHSRCLGGAEASLSAWYDWILAADAEGRRALTADDYGGDTVAAQLFRAEHHLVAHDERERCLHDFASMAELQDWLNDALTPTGLRVTVVALEATKDEPALVSDLVHPVEEDPTAALTPDLGLRYRPLPFGTPEAFAYVEDEVGEHFCSMVRVGFDGAIPAWVHAVYFAPRSHFEHWGVQELAEDEHAWWGIRVGQTDVCLVVPRGTEHQDWPMNVRAGFDDDGSEAIISIRPTSVAERENRLEDQFGRRWGRWLDSSVVLDEQEVLGGVREIEALLDNEFGGRRG